MAIPDLCSRNLICVQPEANLQYAARLMKKHHVGSVVVVEANSNDKPIGILTDRDIVLSVVAENRPLDTKVQEIMSKEVVKVSPDKGIAEVVDQMEQNGVRRIVVVDSTGRACGVVSSDDILQLVAREIYGLGRVVQRELEKEQLSRSPSRDTSDQTEMAFDAPLYQEAKEIPGFAR